MELVSVAESLEFVGSPLYVSDEEEIRPSFDFDALMENGEHIRDSVVTVYEMPQETDVSASIAGTPTYSESTKVLVALSGFTAGKTYRIEVLADVYGITDPFKKYVNYLTIHCESRI